MSARASLVMTAILAAGIPAWLPPAVAQAGASAGGPQVFAEVLGAVVQPGPVSSGDDKVTVDHALALAGGTRPGAYRFAAMLLRTVAQTPATFPCVTPSARHAALLMGDDPGLREQDALIAGLLDGRVQRMSAQGRPFGRLGSDRGGQTVLRGGDVLAVPAHTNRVYIVLDDGQVESAEHLPELMADDYLDQVSADRLARRGDYVLHYPDGAIAELALEAWNAEPTAVPPGSMLAPAAGCLPVVD